MRMKDTCAAINAANEMDITKTAAVTTRPGSGQTECNALVVVGVRPSNGCDPVMPTAWRLSLPIPRYAA